MKNSSKRRVLFTSVIMLIVAVMSLTTATYAWFVSSQEGQINGIEMTAVGAGGILFSADGVNYTDTLAWADFAAGKNVKLPKTGTTYNALSSPLTTAQASSTVPYLMPFFSMDPLANPAYGTATAETETDDSGSLRADYIRLDVYFSIVGADAAAKTLYLDNTTQLLAESVDANDTALLQALRVAFVYYGQGVEAGTPGDKSDDSYLTAPNVVIWAPATTVDGSTVADYKAIPSAGNYVMDSAKTFATGPYATTPGGANACLSITPSSFTRGITNDVTLVATPAVGYHKLTVYIWIEGQDPSCTATAAAGKIAGNLVFILA